MQVDLNLWFFQELEAFILTKEFSPYEREIILVFDLTLPTQKFNFFADEKYSIYEGKCTRKDSNQ